MASVAHKFQEKARTGDVILSEAVTFDGLLLSKQVLNGLKNSGFERPSPIQLKAIPLGRCGLDLIVQAKSGTGKTCVFSVIALESVRVDTSSTQVLVLAPTREIAVQIWEVINSIGSATSGLLCHTFIGGLPLQEDRIKLKKCHIAVGTPGRVKQLIEGGVLRTDSIRLFVLDEADKLLEESFQEQINWIYSTLPENKQMLALSATYPEYLANHLTAYMRNPTFLRLNITDPALLGIRQFYTTVPYHPVPHAVFEEKTKVLIHLLSSVSFQQCLVFSNLQTRAQTLADVLNSKGWPTACIAGCLDQKDRNEAMARLKTYKCRILISTDLTSRGIDADKVNMVINLDVPKDHETYLHRIGRAGRFGSFGIAVSLISDGQEKLNLDSIQKRCNTQINTLPDPLPSDLAHPDGPVYLDDVVSAEVINTDLRNSKIQTSSVKLNVTDTTHSMNSASTRKLNVTELNMVLASPEKHVSGRADKQSQNGNEGETEEGLDGDDDDDDDVNEFEKDVTYESGLITTNGDICEPYVEDENDEILNAETDIKLYFEIAGDRSDKSSTLRYKEDAGKNETNDTKGMANDPERELIFDIKDTEFLKETPVLSGVNRQKNDRASSSTGRKEQTVSFENKTVSFQNHSLTSVVRERLNNTCSSMEKVRLTDIYKSNIGFKSLRKSHTYSSARESLLAFRNDVSGVSSAVAKADSCIIPRCKETHPELAKLKENISEIQDTLNDGFSGSRSENVRLLAKNNDIKEGEDSGATHFDGPNQMRVAVEEQIKRTKNSCQKSSIGIEENDSKKQTDLNQTQNERHVEKTQQSLEKASNENVMIDDIVSTGKFRELTVEECYKKKVQLQETKEEIGPEISSTKNFMSKENRQRSNGMQKKEQKPRRQKQGYRNKFAIGYLLQQQTVEDKEDVEDEVSADETLKDSEENIEDGFKGSGSTGSAANLIDKHIRIVEDITPDLSPEKIFYPLERNEFAETVSSFKQSLDKVKGIQDLKSTELVAETKGCFHQKDDDLLTSSKEPNDETKGVFELNDDDLYTSSDDSSDDSSGDSMSSSDESDSERQYRNEIKSLMSKRQERKSRSYADSSQHDDRCYSRVSVNSKSFAQTKENKRTHPKENQFGNRLTNGDNNSSRAKRETRDSYQEKMETWYTQFQEWQKLYQTSAPNLTARSHSHFDYRQNPYYYQHHHQFYNPQMQFYSPFQGGLGGGAFPHQPDNWKGASFHDQNQYIKQMCRQPKPVVKKKKEK